MKKQTPFEKQLAIFRNKNSTPCEKALAKIKLDEMEKKRNEWNKKNNPKKYYADMSKKISIQNAHVMKTIEEKIFDKNGQVKENAKEKDMDEYVQETKKRSERLSYYEHMAFLHKHFIKNEKGGEKNGKT